MTKIFTAGVGLLLCCCGTLSAQDLATPLLRGSWQSTFANPALYSQLEGELTIGLPGLSNEFHIENVSVEELVGTRDGRRLLDLSALPGLLEERNQISDFFVLETIGIGLRGDRLSAGAYHRLHTNGSFDYNRNLIRLIAEGNAQFIGQTVDITPFGTAVGYHELGLGLAFDVTDKIAIGGRIKYLSGIEGVRIQEGSRLSLTTGEDNFALSLDQDAVVNSSGIVDFESLDDIQINLDLLDVDSGPLFNENNGLAFDVGIHLDFDNLRIQAAANDLGAKIDWTQNVSNLTFSGVSEFTGLDILRQVLDDSVSFTVAVDSLNDIFSPTEDNNAWSYSIGAHYLLGAEFDVDDKLTVGAMVLYRDRFLGGAPAVMVSGRYQFLNWLAAGVHYNYRDGSAANLGANLYLTPGPVQFFAGTDNLTNIFGSSGGTRSSVRLGLALAFRRKVSTVD